MVYIMYSVREQHGTFWIQLNKGIEKYCTENILMPRLYQGASLSFSTLLCHIPLSWIMIYILVAQSPKYIQFHFPFIFHTFLVRYITNPWITEASFTDSLVYNCHCHLSFNFYNNLQQYTRKYLINDWVVWFDTEFATIFSHYATFISVHGQLWRIWSFGVLIIQEILKNAKTLVS